MTVRRVAHVKSSFDWSPDVIAKARALWDDGVSTKQIAKAIGTSKNSLLGKVHRLGWPSRPSPIKGSMGAPKPPKPLPIGSQATLPPFIRAAPLPIQRHITFSRPASCQWIDGAPTRHAAFCGAPTQRGSSYCVAHHACCWLRFVPKNLNPKIGAAPVRDGRANDRRQAFPPE